MKTKRMITNGPHTPHRKELRGIETYYEIGLRT